MTISAKTCLHLSGSSATKDVTICLLYPHPLSAGQNIPSDSCHRFYALTRSLDFEDQSLIFCFKWKTWVVNEWLVPDSEGCDWLYLAVSKAVQVSSLLLDGVELELQTGDLRHQLQLLGLQRGSAQQLLRGEGGCRSV